MMMMIWEVLSPVKVPVVASDDGSSLEEEEVYGVDDLEDARGKLKCWIYNIISRAELKSFSTVGLSFMKLVRLISF